MSDDTDLKKHELPKEAPSVGKATMVGAILAPAIMASFVGIVALMAKLPYLKTSKFWNALKDGYMKQHTPGNYVAASIFGGLLGNIMGGQAATEYDLRVKNVELQNKVEALETDKSFTKALIQEKIDDIKKPPCGCKFRG